MLPGLRCSNSEVYVKIKTFAARNFIFPKSNNNQGILEDVGSYRSLCSLPKLRCDIHRGNIFWYGSYKQDSNLNSEILNEKLAASSILCFCLMGSN